MHPAQEIINLNLFWIGLYFGVIAIMVLYNGIILAMVRNRTYVYYILYVISFGWLQFLLFGLGFRYLWPESSTLNNTLTMLTPSVVFASEADGGRVGSISLKSRWVKPSMLTMPTVPAPTS